MNSTNAIPNRLRSLWHTGGRIIWPVSIVIALGLMLWATVTSLSEISAQQLHFDGWMFLYSLVVRSIALFLNIYLWSKILTSSGGTTSFLKNFIFYCYTNLVKRLPTPVWLMAGRAHLYEKAGTRVAVTSMSTSVEALIAITSGLITVLIFVPAGLPALPTWMKALAVVGAMSVWVASSEPRLLQRAGGWLGRVLKQPIMFEHVRRRDLFYWNFVHTASWIMGGIMMYFVLGIITPVSIAILPAVIWAWAFSGILGFLRFLMPFLFGTREISLALLLSALGVAPLALAAVASALSRLCLIVGDLLWVVIARVVDSVYE